MPKLLDLYCGGGGAGMGYHMAGFDVVGVDLHRQRHYPFEFHQGDALTYPLDGFDVIHASPPCQAYSITKHAHSKEHPDLVPQTRERLQASGLPYVIENVPGAPLHTPLTLCGSEFNLTAYDPASGLTLALKRHRLFESNVFLLGAGGCTCILDRRRGRIGGVYGGGSVDRSHARQVRHGGYTPALTVSRQLMGIDWLPPKQLAQAIPPAYTEHIGQQLMAQLRTADYSV